MSSDNPQTGPDTGHAIDAARGPGSRTRRREKRRKLARPLDEATLRDLAMSYVARFATTGAKLERYLACKLRERGVVEDDTGRSWEPDVGALVASFVEAGYVDDEAYARARSRDLSARGYGARRVDQALYAAGVAQDVRETHAPGEAETRRAAILLARKRRFGPFAGPGKRVSSDPQERRKQRDRQVAAMLRAGHSYGDVAFILDAGGPGEIDTWLAEAEAEEAEAAGGGGLW